MKSVFTVAEVAKICKVSPRTVGKWFDSGRLRGYRVPGSQDRRIPRERLIEFLESHGLPTHDLEIKDHAMTRTFANVAKDPQPGDAVEMLEVFKDPEDGTEFLGDTMLRVLAVKENWVWFKEYGRPNRPSLPLKMWEQRLWSSQNGKVISEAQ